MIFTRHFTLHTKTALFSFMVFLRQHLRNEEYCKRVFINNNIWPRQKPTFEINPSMILSERVHRVVDNLRDLEICSDSSLLKTSRSKAIRQRSLTESHSVRRVEVSPGVPGCVSHLTRVHVIRPHPSAVR